LAQYVLRHLGLPSTRLRDAACGNPMDIHRVSAHIIDVMRRRET
jgi:hypothetical protein